MRPPRTRRRLVARLLAAALLLLLALLGLAVSAVEVASYAVDLPPGLERRAESTRVLDRHGRLLREIRSDDQTRARPIPLDRISPHMVEATLAAEDRRFREHGGIDPLALGRAMLQNLRGLRVVSGASTLTMQLARLLRGGDRTLGNKFVEMALARRIERTLSKDRILEEYLNRAPYGNGFAGVEAAAWGYFRKSAADLSLGEAAALAALPRSPELYDPYRHLDRVRARRDRILERMRGAGTIDEARLRRARAEPLRFHPPLRRFEAPHFVEWVRAEAPRAAEIRTTLDLDLQRRVEVLVERTVRDLRERGGRDAAVVVIENATGDLLAYVGSADFDDPEAGQVDGARALRQPGSAVKPFTYALAFERGYHPASILPDLPARYRTGDRGDYQPRNYDGRFHGPVRAREALANSYNVPAVFLADALTPAALLETYRAFGLDMLREGPDYYGVALTLGDGEVTLLALAGAYATLARGGRRIPTRALLEPTPPPEPERRVVSPLTAWLVTDVLSDRRARVAAFGEGNVLELPFPVAAKTGTSKAYRDNWAVGYTREITVAVWVGNFSGEPMGSVSGITGAGPLFRDVMLAAMEGRHARRTPAPDGLVPLRLCALSGRPAGPDCPLTLLESLPAPVADRLGAETCPFHRRIAIDRRTGGLAGPGCPPEAVERRLFEQYPPEYRPWAREAGRPLPPDTFSPFCPASSAVAVPPGAAAGAGDPFVLLSPIDGARYSIDPDADPTLQTLPLQAAAPDGAVVFLVDGRPVAETGPPYRTLWRLQPGDHVVAARWIPASGSPVERSVRITVQGLPPTPR
jgi:penicillin-binding protein 1C